MFLANLSVNFAGIELEFPTAISAGPLTRNGISIKKAAQQYGVGAVITRTVFKEAVDTPRPSMVAVKENLLNFDWWAMGAKQMVKELKIAKEGKKPVIASIMGKIDDLVGIAKLLGDAGADMLELPIGAPSLEELGDDIKRIKEVIEIPLGVKIGPNIQDIPRYAKTIEQAGADFISGINTLGPGLAIDIFTGKPLLGARFGYGYLSGPAIKPIAVRCIAEISKTVKIPILGGGGIADGKDAIEMFMVGATCIHLHTAAILRGLGIFEKIIKEIEDFMDRMGYKSIGEIKGLSLHHMKEEATYTLYPATVNPELCNGCGICERICVYDAIKVEEGIAKVNREVCFGCGLCKTKCPTQAIKLE